MENFDVPFEEMFPEIVQYLPWAFFFFFLRDVEIQRWDYIFLRVRRYTLQSVAFRRLCVSARKIKSRGWLLEVGSWDFAGGPAARTLCPQCMGLSFNPWSGN